MTLQKQIAFMEKLLHDRETSSPVKIQMGRITQEEADQGIAQAKAVLATLRVASKPAPVEAAPVIGVKAVVRLQAAMLEVHKCAKANSEMCPHCQSIANLLGEIGSMAL